MLKKGLQSLIIGLLSIMAAMILWYFDWLTFLENKTWDWRTSLMARPGKETEKGKYNISRSRLPDI